MSGPAIRLHGGIAIMAALLAFSPAAAADEPREPSGGLVESMAVPEPRDAIAPGQLAEIRAAIAAYEKRHPARARKDEGPFLYPFFPHAGILGRDLFLNNFTDQDPSRGLVLDWDCSDYTYDDHHGHDSLIRSFREQAIGVPVFAALDGVVVRSVTSAALTDLLPAGTAQPNDRVTCRVVPADSKSLGKAAVAAAMVEAQ